MRCFVNDGEERWLMWYSGRARGQNGQDAVFPAAGSIGKSHVCLTSYDMHPSLKAVVGSPDVMSRPQPRDDRVPGDYVLQPPAQRGRLGTARSH